MGQKKGNYKNLKLKKKSSENFLKEKLKIL
jgi:hypothetical protein